MSWRTPSSCVGVYYANKGTGGRDCIFHRADARLGDRPRAVGRWPLLPDRKAHVPVGRRAATRGVDAQQVTSGIQPIERQRTGHVGARGGAELLSRHGDLGGYVDVPDFDQRPLSLSGVVLIDRTAPTATPVEARSPDSPEFMNRPAPRLQAQRWSAGFSIATCGK